MESTNSLTNPHVHRWSLHHATRGINLVVLAVCLWYFLGPVASTGMPDFNRSELSLIDIVRVAPKASSTEPSAAPVAEDTRTRPVELSIKAKPKSVHTSTVRRIAALTEVAPSNTEMYDLRHLKTNQLRAYMVKRGFRDLEGKGLNQLREVYLAYAYDAVYWDVHELTGFPISMIYAYFIYEATNKHRIETKLWRNGWNPGGIKAYGEYASQRAYDDCEDEQGNTIPCDFLKMNGYASGISAWANTLSKPRYRACKSEKTAEAICKCMQKSGYHTDPRTAGRAGVMKRYWAHRKHFPA